MTNREQLNRRHVLKLLAATAAGASIPWLRTPSAYAQSNDVPLRFLHVDLGAGILRGDWEPTAAGGGAATSTDWTLRGPYAQLERWKTRMNLFGELDMVSVRRDTTDADNAHINGLTHQLTAGSRLPGNGALAGGVSIDQLIAQHLNSPNPITRLPSLEIAGQEHGEVIHAASYAAPGQAVPYLVRPDEVYDRLFPEPLGDDVRIAARRTSVANMVRGEYDRLLGRLSGPDRTKIQQMRDLRAELHDRLNITNIRAANRPGRSILNPYEMLEDRWQTGSLDNRRWSVKVDSMIQLAAAALHTDTTRVVNLSINDPPGYEFGYTSGEFGTTDTHDLDHQVSGRNPMLNDPNATGRIREMQRMKMAKFVFLLEELERLQETDGQSLLDHTLILATSHIAEGSHDVTALPWFTLGNAQGYLRTGLYTEFPLAGDGNLDSDSHRIYIFEGRPHGDLFTTVANAMGVGISSFGNPDIAQGPISEIIA